MLRWGGIALLLLLIALLYYNFNLPPYVEGRVSLETGAQELPADNRLTLTIEELAGSKVAEIAFEDVQLPVDFKISYDAEDISQTSVYSLKASLSDSRDQVLFISRQDHRVITDGEDLEVEVVLTPVAEEIDASAGPDSQEAAEDGAETEPDWISGRVSFETAEPLPAGAVLSVKLRRADLEEEGQFLAETIVRADTSPLPFELAYDASNINDGLAYILEAVISDGQDSVLFASSSPQGVLTQGQPNADIEIELQPASP